MSTESKFLISWHDGELIYLQGTSLITAFAFNYDVVIDSISKGFSDEIIVCLSKAPEGIYKDTNNKIWINEPCTEKTTKVWPVLSEVEKNAMEVADAMDGLKVEVVK
jgi:hypothetical protein